MTAEDEPITDLITSLWETFADSVEAKDLTAWRPDIDGLMTEAAERNSTDALHPLANWVHIFDQLLGWLIQVTFVIHGSVLASENTKSRATYLTVLGTCVHHALAIRKLCLDGFDVPAKQVLRAMVEYRDLLIMFAINPELILEFNAAEEPSQANGFWHKNLSKGKARRLIDNHISSFGDIRNTEEWRAWREEELQVLGAAIHPSAIASFAAYTGVDERTDDRWPAFLGMKSNASIRTIRTAFSTLLELILYSPALQFWDSEKAKFALAEFDEENVLHRVTKTSWPAIVAISAWAISHQEDPRLISTRSIDHWFDKSGSETPSNESG